MLGCASVRECLLTPLDLGAGIPSFDEDGDFPVSTGVIPVPSQRLT
jgi:hypothetical protein